MDLYLNNKYLTTLNVEDISEYISTNLRLQDEEYYLLQNGKPITLANAKTNFMTHIILRLPGGKGGFGSMLRAIGAQIEKTTNREACRDLSGRRLRDINEEKRLKAWIDSQNTRDQEAADRKQKKLERLCQKPRHEFRDETYDKERSALPERLEDAVEQGLAAASSSTKRKSETLPKNVKKKKALWVDEGLEGLSSGSDVSDSDDDDGGSKSVPVVSSTSGDVKGVDMDVIRNLNDGSKLDENVEGVVNNSGGSDGCKSEITGDEGNQKEDAVSSNKSDEK